MSLRWVWLATAFVLMGCGDFDGADGETDDAKNPVGGWSTASDGFHACFGPGGDLAVGDDLWEVEKYCCNWSIDGSLEVNGVAGSWSISDEKLTLVADCTEEDCGPFTYSRDNTLPCP